MTTRIEIELTADQVAALRKSGIIDLSSGDAESNPLDAVLCLAAAALPPEPIWLKVELAPDLFDWISTPGEYGAGMEIGPFGAGILNAVNRAAMAAKEEGR